MVGEGVKGGILPLPQPQAHPPQRGEGGERRVRLAEFARLLQMGLKLPLPPAALGDNYSYGCDKPESDGRFSYPNTSCVDNLATPTVYYTAEPCTDNIMPSPCEGVPVSRMYWQHRAERERQVRLWLQLAAEDR